MTAGHGLDSVAVAVADPKGAAGSANIRTERFEMPVAGMDYTLTTAEGAADLAAPGSASIVERGTAHAGFGAELAVDISGATPLGAPHDEALAGIEMRSSSHWNAFGATDSTLDFVLASAALSVREDQSCDPSHLDRYLRGTCAVLR